MPSLLTFAKPRHVTFGSDWPFATIEAGQYYAAGLEASLADDQSTLDAVNRTNALALFPRLATAKRPRTPDNLAPRTR